MKLQLFTLNKIPSLGKKINHMLEDSLVAEYVINEHQVQGVQNLNLCVCHNQSYE